jgi:hypothetical protein
MGMQDNVLEGFSHATLVELRKEKFAAVDGAAR